MRSALVILSLPFIIIGFAFWAFNRSSKAGHELDANLGRLMMQLERESWEDARLESQRLQETWDRVQRVWGPLMDHDELDNLGLSIMRTIRLTEQEDQKEALTEADVARAYSKHIIEREKPLFSNVF